MEYAVFKQQIMEQAKRILPQEEGYVITIVDQTEYGLGDMLIINKSDKEVVPGISMEDERSFRYVYSLWSVFLLWTRGMGDADRGDFEAEIPADGSRKVQSNQV